MQAQGYVLNETVNANSGAAIILDGGYDAEYSERSGSTTIKQLTVTSGSVNVSNIVIQ